MITKYGYFTVLIVTIITIALIIISLFIEKSFIKIPIIITAIGFFIFTLYFFRDPSRKIKAEENQILSPADGTVLIIKNVVDNNFIGEEATQISIFMSPLNVHVNRIPISGKVSYINYIEGEYLIASHDKADKRNERNEIGITGKYGKIFFTQVAGMVARRIVCDLKEGDTVLAGEKFGMIKFGSRVDILASKNFTIKIKEGEKVTAGKTILFECKNEN